MGLAEIVILGLAGHRVYRFAALDDAPILVAIRRRVLGEDALTMNGQTIRHWTRPKLKDLLLCPWCLGTYIAPVLVAVAIEAPGVAKWLVGSLAVGEVIGLVHRNLDPPED